MTRARLAPLALAFGLALVVPATAAPDAVSGADVRKAFKSGEKPQVVEVLQRLHDQLDKTLMKALLAEAPRVKALGVYDELVATLRTARGEALDELCKQGARHKRSDVRFLCVDSLGRNPDPLAERTLIESLTEDEDETVAVMAARSLGRRGSASAVDGLIPVLAKLEEDARKTRLVREVSGALAQLTGQDLSAAQDWKNYWDAHKSEFSGAGLQDDGASHVRDETVMDRMRRERPAETRTMERLRDDEIIVIKGRSDKVELVLEALQLPHQKHEREAFDSLTLDPARQVLIMNCAGRDELSEAGVAKVREFVARGGYLFTSDWELKNVLARAFPEAVQFQGESPKEERKVSIRPQAESTSHPLLRDVFPLNSWLENAFTWTLDGRSHLVKPNPALTVLVTAPDMESMGSSSVAFCFGFTSEGGGRPVTGAPGGRRRGPRGGQVLHVLSHFKNQKDKSGDGFALQQILLNFIVEKQEQRKAEAAGR